MEALATQARKQSTYFSRPDETKGISHSSCHNIIGQHHVQEQRHNYWQNKEPNNLTSDEKVESCLYLVKKAWLPCPNRTLIFSQ